MIFLSLVRRFFGRISFLRGGRQGKEKGGGAGLGELIITRCTGQLPSVASRTYAMWGRTPPSEMMALSRSLLSSSSLRIASCRWRGVIRRFLLSCAALPASSQISATRSARARE
jgi:hypothetical protein